METLFSECVIWSAGVDWLTMTYRPEEYLLWARALTICEVLAEQKAMEGHRPKSGRLRDYEGIKTEGLFWGARADSYIIEASSETADNVARFLIANGCEGRASRLDCQATIQFSNDDETRATQIYDEIRQKKAEGKWQAKMGLTLVETCGRGDSLAIGSRTSSRYRRIYDKTREQAFKVAPRLWRWEVEHKAEVAQDALRAIIAAEETVKISKAIVAAEFVRCGLFHPWMALSAHHQLKTAHAATDDEKRLRWLQTQVRSTFLSLRNNGKESDALDAIGYWGDT